MRTSLALAALVLAGTAEAQTNGYVLQCMSARAAGQGCVTRARDDVPTDLLRDPAAIGWFKRPAFEANISPFMPSLTFRNSANAQTVDGARHAYPLASFAYVGPKFTPKLSWAVGMEPVGGFGSDFKLSHALLGANQDYESFFAALKMGPALAYELAPGFTIGASAYASYAQIRDFRMPFTLPPSAAKGLGGLVQLDPQHYPALFSQVTELTAYGDSYDFAGWGWGGSLGFAWKPSDALRMSASWSPRMRLDLDGATAVIDMNTQFQAMFGLMVQERMQNHGMAAQAAQGYVAQALGAAGMNLQLGAKSTYQAATELSDPQTVGAGMSLKLNDRWRLGVEGVWMDWSAAASTMPFKMTNGNNANVNILVNGNPTAANFTYPFPLNWDDSFTGKAGLEFKATNATTLRGGYLYGNNPVPDNTVFIAFPAISEQALTAGAGFALGGVSIETSLVRALTSTVTGTSGAHLLGAEYRNSRTTMNQTVVTIGAVWKY
jgi:long-subunit fatty acid transport protein